ncbi:MAG: 30S ribosomal protein S20 [Calditrichae bacterium]|nr:30S ribosomal protein S20 [Calditrichia bacterium]
MAHHKSAIKRIKIGERNRLRNRILLSEMKKQIKLVLKSSKKEDGLESYNSAASILDKMAKKGFLHRNTAANKKARLMRHVNSLT